MQTSQGGLSFRVLAGPSLGQVFEAVMSCYTATPLTPEFKLEFIQLPRNPMLKLRLRGVDHESGKPGMLNLVGYVEFSDVGIFAKNKEFRMFYNANTFEGVIHFEGNLNLV